MTTYLRLKHVALTAVLAFAPAIGGCGDAVGSGDDNITDVQHTDIERQSIGNCWIYAHASWVESLNLAATGKQFDVSQSYWTYWHWYDQIIQDGVDEIGTGGSYWVANDIVLDRGLMPEAKFVKEDTTAEMSSRQHDALDTMNRELKEGRLATYEARSNGELVRKVLNEAWGLGSTVKSNLNKVFGKDGRRTLRDGPSTKYTSIIKPTAFKVQYTKRSSSGSVELKNTYLDVAIDEWQSASYPSWGSNIDSARRALQIRLQRAAHDRQPVIITWDVDFNALENAEGALQGSFNMTTLTNAGGPGRQGGHMTVLEDYQVETQQYGVLAAGVTLDPNKPGDKAKLDAALLPSSEIQFLRIKNSWGTLRPDREFAPGYPGYHDLYLDYLNGPITWCPDVEETKTSENCTGTTNPFDSIVLPPGY